MSHEQKADCANRAVKLGFQRLSLFCESAESHWHPTLRAEGRRT